MLSRSNDEPCLQMPIPGLDNEGFLPVGVHECTIEEVEEAFGAFRSSDQRPRLFGRLRDYVAELKNWGIVKEIFIDGSFVTVKDSPGDVDLIVVAPEDFMMPSELAPASYNTLSRTRVKRTYGFDMALVPRGSTACSEWIEFFQQVKDMPGRQKGILTVRL